MFQIRKAELFRIIMKYSQLLSAKTLGGSMLLTEPQMPK